MHVQGVQLCHDKLFADIYDLWYSCKNRSFAAIDLFCASLFIVILRFFSYVMLFTKLMHNLMSPCHVVLEALVGGWSVETHTVCQAHACN